MGGRDEGRSQRAPPPLPRARSRSRCSAADSPAGAATSPTLSAPSAEGPLQATIRRDAHGIPNIIGDNFADLGFGYGYSFAEDNICTIAETYVTVRGERSRYSGDGVQGSFGPDGSYLQRGNGFYAPTTSTPTSSTSGSSTITPSRTCSTSRRLTARSMRSARGFAATSPATTSTSRTPASTTCPIRAAAAPTGSSRSARWTPTGASTSSRCSPRQTVAIDGIADAEDARRRLRRRSTPTGSPQGLQANLKLRDRLERLSGSAREATANGKGHGARQPALPLGRTRALLPGASDHPRQGQRLGRQPLRRAAGPDRPHRQPRLEPHGLDRLPLHAVPGDHQPARPDPVPL